MKTDEDLAYRDFDRRAKEIIAELSKDGYPDAIQMTIVGATLCMLLAKSAESAEHLAEGLAISKEMLDEGAQMWFEERKRGTGNT
jgi:hypothetical protein